MVAALVALPLTGSGIAAIFVLAALEWRRGARFALPGRWSGRL